MAPRKKANAAGAGLSEYEKLRQKRIEENKAKLAELGLDSIASEIAPGRSVDRAESSVPTKTLESNIPTRRSARNAGKRKVPSDSGDSGEEDQELLIVRKTEDYDYVPAGQASASDSEDDEIDLEEETTKDEDELQQAIALSLEESGSKRSRSKTAPVPPPKQKGRLARKVCFQLSEEEIDAMYHSIVGTGAGLSLRELQLAAASNDFTWDLRELREMISIFDTDKDGMLSLAEFRSMASRSRLVQGF